MLVPPHTRRYDVEPMALHGSKRVDRSPSPSQKRQTLEDACRIYDAWKKIASCHSEVVWILLVQSSQHHYHVWVLFEHPLIIDQHQEFLERAKRIHGQVWNLDKTTLRGKGRFGDQFRAPWSWKKMRKSEALLSWIRDEELVIRLGDAAAPKQIEKRPLAPIGADFDTHLQGAIHKFVIEQLGQRDNVQARLVGSFVGRGFDKDFILRIGCKWLEHYKDKYEAPFEQAKVLLGGCLQRTINNSRFTRAKASVDYEEVHRSRILTPEQKLFLNEVMSNNYSNGVKMISCDPLPKRDLLHYRVEDHNFVEDHNNNKKVEDHKFSSCLLENGKQKLSVLRQEELFIEALILHCYQKLQEVPGSKVKMTNQQIIDIIRDRHGFALHSQQFHRLKMKFVTFAVGKDGELIHSAKRVELLRELQKGHPGVPSNYEVTGLAPVVTATT